MTISIQGLAFPLNEKNLNEWGVHESEAENAIKTLKASVIRVCPRDSPHGCDFAEDPKAEIGRVTDAWKEGNAIFARASITDSTAEQKITDGTWEPTWSVYLKAAELNDGWASGIEARSLTLVKNPAWNQASWSIAASDGEKPLLRTISKFTIITASQNTQGGHMPTDEIETLKKELAEKEATIQELTPKVASISTLEKQVEELTASKTTLEKELSEKVSLIASFEKEKAGSVPMETVKTLIASAIADHDAEKAKETERETAFKAFASAREEVGLETKQEDFKTLSASDLSKLAEEFSGVKLSAGAQYPATPTGTNTACTGAYNAKTGAWE
ncbi:hypothetical protein DU52_15585 [Methanosarcina mazei]|uniref:Uncharacterized protein n=1 Tax=Methanosarcina mazei TaxID=2209 RepID=A0A0F8GSJ7_METMZ|nr:hypothetical protein [Methanosarcina mazei]KKG35360.1 hypothetical protein DU52_15585 [Methanosarcina mazei]